MYLLNAHGLIKDRRHAFFLQQESVAIDELAGGLPFFRLSHLQRYIDLH